MRKHLIRHLLILLLTYVLVLATLMVIPASGDSDKPDPIEALEDLIKDISGLPPGTVRTQQTTTICNKIRAAIHQVEDGAYKGAINKLGNDVINAIEGWVYAESASRRLVGKAEYIIDLILGLIQPVHDIAIIDLCVTPTEVTMGEIVYANVTVVNRGTEIEVFDVYVYADAITIKTLLNLTLDPEANTTLSFSWDTTSVNEGAYTLSSEVPPVAGEKDVEDNFFVGEIVTVSLLLKHDVAITKVRTPLEVTQGTRVTISVDAANLGDFDETINVSVTYDEILIETLILTPLDFGASVMLIFFWDTREVEPNTYTIAAEAFLDGDENLTNNRKFTLITIISGPAAPTAAFSSVTLALNTNEIGTWDATASYDPDGDIIWYYWSFGDSTFLNATAPIASHNYSDNGAFTIVLAVGDDDGLTDTVSTNVTVFNRAPVANFTKSAESVNTGETVIFDASESYDPDGYIASYFWDFGDGKNGTGKIVNYTYTTSGNYAVKLIVTDDDGAPSSLSDTEMVTTPSGLPLAWFAAIGLGVAALTATLLYALYRKRKKGKR